MTKSLRFLLLLVGLLPMLLGPQLMAKPIVRNGDFETDRNDDGTPDGWGRPNAEKFYVTEDGNTFLRMRATEPDKVIMQYMILDVPKGAEAMELKWDWRVTGLKAGVEPWYDARIMLKAVDQYGKKLNVGGGDPYTRQSTKGWQSKSRQFLLPEGTVCVEVMPTLFQVKAGTFDLDNLSLEAIDPAALKERMAQRAAERARLHVDAEAPKPENWPSELKVVGNRLENAEGEHVWLQGINIPSLEWNPAGENVLKSTQVAIEDWNANCIRLPVKEEYWFGKRGDAYKKLVNDVIVYAANRGVYVVLDLHRFRAAKEVHAKFWSDAAAIYANNPSVLFDLLNEPHGTSWEVWRNGGYVAEKTTKADEDAFLSEEERIKNKQGFHAVGMQALVEAVRSTGARNVIVAGGLDWAYDLSGILNGYALEDSADGNGIMYSTHVYPWKRDWQGKFLDVAEEYPILVGEVGGDAKKMTFMPADVQEDVDTWVPSMLGAIQEYQLNWTGWCFHPKSSPRMLVDWTYEPTPFWGKQAKEALGGKQFKLDHLR